MERQETGSFSLMKNINMALVLKIIRENENISRAHVAKISGLTPATVTNLTYELIAMNLVEEAERGVSRGGRKPVMLRMRKDVFAVAGVYIGSKVIQIVLADLDANVLKKEQITRLHGLTQEDALARVVGIIKKLMGETDLKVIGIGVGFHGLVKRGEGIAVFAPNLGWENVRVQDILESEFHIPVVVDNDVRAMTVGERYVGMAKNNEDFILLYVGSGIGGSIVMNNNLYAGATGVAGEFGHTTVLPDGPLCTCGNRGCLQALASEGAIIERYRVLSENDAQVDFEYVLQKALAGDRSAVKAISDSAHYIGIAVANLINIFNPSMVIISGNIARMGSMVMAILNEEVNRRCMEYTQNSTRIVFANNKNEAFLRGAASLVISELLQNPARIPVSSGL